MVKESDNETEILLGNKQLIGIFFVLAVLLGVAFTGGYMVGHGSAKKTAANPVMAPAQSDTATSAAPSAHTGGETHSVGAEGASDEAQSTDTQSEPATSAPNTETTHPAKSTASSAKARKTEESTANNEEAAPAPAETASSFTPQSGQTFLQVAAVGRNEAEEIADVLHKKGFRAHAVPKPGNPKIYRVLIGPIRDTADLSNTRDSLRHTGFGEVIVQRY